MWASIHEAQGLDPQMSKKFRSKTRHLGLGGGGGVTGGIQYFSGNIFCFQDNSFKRLFEFFRSQCYASTATWSHQRSIVSGLIINITRRLFSINRITYLKC